VAEKQFQVKVRLVPASRPAAGRKAVSLGRRFLGYVDAVQDGVKPDNAKRRLKGGGGGNALGFGVGTVEQVHRRSVFVYFSFDWLMITRRPSPVKGTSPNSCLSRLAFV